MADLNRRDRGQIILIAAFALAVLFVSLALIVNSAIFTENLASRGETTGSDGALMARAMAEENVGNGVRSANTYNYTSPNLMPAIEKSVRNMSGQRERQQVLSGGLVNVTNPHDEEIGSRVAMNDTGGGNYTDTGQDTISSSGDWLLVDRVEEDYAGQPHTTRAFEMEIKGGSDLSSDDLLSLTGRFTVVVNNTGSPSRQWKVKVWKEDANPTHIHVQTELPSGTTEECEKVVTDDSIRISLTEGTVDSRPCDALGYHQASDTDFSFASGVSTPYNISYENGDTVKGNYSLVTTNPKADGNNLDNLDNGPSAGPAPYITRAVYEVDVEFSFVNSNINYTTDVRVAPGESDG